MKPHDLAELLLAKARSDLQAAKVLAQALDVADEAVGFHAQQAVEKALKASLTMAGVRVGRTHELGRLIELLADAGMDVPEWLRGTQALDPFAVTFRYSETNIDEPLDRAATIALTERAVNWAAEQVQATH